MEVAPAAILPVSVVSPRIHRGRATTVVHPKTDIGGPRRYSGRMLAKLGAAYARITHVVERALSRTGAVKKWTLATAAAANKLSVATLQ